MSYNKGVNQDMLALIFQMQTELNDHIFAKQSLSDPNGSALKMHSISTATHNDELGVNALPNQWLTRYAQAMSDELKELNDELLWKWWSRDQIDLQNIRVELIDILHFLVSAMIAAGLTPERVHDIYQQKHAVNIRRQDTGYSQSNKDESENRTIA